MFVSGFGALGTYPSRGGKIGEAGSETSMGADLPKRRTLLLMKRGGGPVPFQPDHPEGDLGFDRGGRRGFLIKFCQFD